MGKTLHRGNAIVAGHPWSLRITFPSIAFPIGIPVIADVKRMVEDVTPLATLSILNGGLVRISDFTIDVHIADTISETWKRGRVLFDFARTDTNVYLGVMVTVPVREPVTRRRAP